jgi:hypothetical protein
MPAPFSFADYKMKLRGENVEKMSISHSREKQRSNTCKLHPYWKTFSPAFTPERLACQL